MVETLLPTPDAYSADRGGAQSPEKRRAGGHSVTLADAATELFPTPSVADAMGGHMTRSGDRSGELLLPGVARELARTPLLPTPAVNDMGAGKTVEAWDEWTAKMRTAHGNGNGHGPSLHIEAARLLPACHGSEQREREDDGTHGDSSPAAAEQGVPSVQSDLQPAPLQRSARGPGALPGTPDLFAELRERQGIGDEGRAPLAGTQAPWGVVRELPEDHDSARTPHRQGPHEQRSEQPADPLRILSPATALDGGPGESHSSGAASRRDCGCAAWGKYASAVHRWEMAQGRVAPPPNEPSGKGGAHRLSARAVEFMMGLPAGHVADVPGTTRNDQLKALGNGVCPQQAAAAIRSLLGGAAVEGAAS